MRKGRRALNGPCRGWARGQRPLKGRKGEERIASPRSRERANTIRANEAKVREGGIGASVGSGKRPPPESSQAKGREMEGKGPAFGARSVNKL